MQTCYHRTDKPAPEFSNKCDYVETLYEGTYIYEKIDCCRKDCPVSGSLPTCTPLLFQKKKKLLACIELDFIFTSFLTKKKRIRELYFIRRNSNIAS
ncbi:hypothetical protein AYI70_g1311 [Smittium culicis]|uniref:Uncharacterized protein n=1 Tax=Smittium culicis TaxID=133412 RepID=A0A1R1YDR0_9FUNG|nr:hypothetical protein AYI70_g1311 [Smittium culicis]